MSEKKRRGAVVIDGDAPGKAPRDARRGRSPILLEGDALEAHAHTPQTAPPVPETDPQGDAAPASGLARALARSGRRRGLISRLIWSAAAAFVSLVAGVILWDFITGLFQRSDWLGWTAFGLVAVIVLGALAGVLRELSALSRLHRIDGLQKRASAARSGSLDQARGLVDALHAFYAGRRDLAWAKTDLDEKRQDILDADALVDAAERTLLAPLDSAAQQEVEAAARHVALVTAMVPLALADVVTALFSNLRMIRRIAAIYGGRAGALGSWQLVRAISAHLVATGALAVGDDMVGAALGGGILSRLSRRVGEGVVNGALTVRVGLAAIEVCRPMAYHAQPSPSTVGILRRALAGIVTRG
ncbi:MAG: TIGR01620 family protein [Pseudomonadota bacterium]